MDTFGTAAQVKGAMLTVFHANRGTGRTDAMLRTLHDGDLVVFANSREAHRVEILAREMGLSIRTAVVSPKRMEDLMSRGTQQGQLVFDHTWLEDYYLSVMEDAYRCIERVREAMSGQDERHAKTRLAAKEMALWQWREPKSDLL